MSWSPESALLAALVIPLIGGVFVGLLGKMPNLREGATLTAAVLLALNVAYLVSVTGERPELAEPSTLLGAYLTGLAFGFKLEPLGALFAAVASGLWIVNSLYSIGYMRGNNEPHQTRFYVFFTIAIACAMGVALSSNLLTMFLFYEALTLSTYPLVAHKGDDKARRGAAIYLAILLGT